MAVQLPSHLPVCAVLADIRAGLRERTTLLVQAPPGAGKSTVVPLALLDEPWLAGRRIVMLEPRRLAARAVALWMAHLLDEAVGATVGYRMRLDTRVGPMTRIEVVTEGILTRRLQQDPALADVAAVIFDEFHERSLQADLGLALCRDVQSALRPDLRLLLMSATLDTAALAGMLGDAPVVTATGRSFPVAIRHAARAPADDIIREVAGTVARALADERGDVLVFLPGVAEIRRTQRLLESMGTAADVLPLYGDLSMQAQERALAPGGTDLRKVVLATSIAETSLTIDGVRIVIDSGLSRRARFDPRTGMTALITVPITRAAAAQRCGRAGRNAPGVCYRLWTQAVDEGLAPFTPPEILEADLAPLALELAAWGITEPGALRWLTPPPAAAYAQARDLLVALSAIDAGGRCSARGRQMSRLGLHPRLAHMLIEAQRYDAVHTACTLAAALSERDCLRVPPAERRSDLRLRLAAVQGDEGTLPAGVSIARRACERARRLAGNWARLLEMLAVRADDGSCPAAPEADDVVGVLLAQAYPDRIAMHRGGEDGRYLLSNGRGASLDRADPLARSEFLVVADLDAGTRDARIWLAAPLSRTAVLTHLRERIEERDVVAWNSAIGAVVARRELRLGKLLIGERALEGVDPAQRVQAMLDGVREAGITALPWTAGTRQWRARVQFLRRVCGPDVGAGWPAIDDADLAATLGQWLAPWLDGITRRADLARVPLANALSTLLDQEQRRQLETLAPTHLPVPSGSRIALDYASGEVPILSARLQELFGMRASPRVAGGRVPVLVQILSPAGRPLQVTQDLAGFWTRGYAEVRKQMRGRYPKHYWPEDPDVAVAIRGVRPQR
ncbi:MAG: ATP-dependent helicase HrpB [Gammaproteobacteria bacterium]|nr:ATP-dependent helicase HrpB [Gammaproteobacteria bacterium]